MKSRSLLVLSALCACILLASCALASGSDAPAPAPSLNATPTQTIAAAIAAPTLPPVLPSPTPTAITRILTLAVPKRWAEAARLASESDPSTRWLLEIVQDPALQFNQGKADVALVSGEQGLIVARRPLVLSVPFNSAWGDVTTEQAQGLLHEPPGDVTVVEWPDIPHTHRPLQVEGLLPDQEGYALQQRWSLLFSDEQTLAASRLAQDLQPLLTQDDVLHLVFVGDVMLDRALGERLLQGELDFPFSHVAQEIESAHLSIGNLESSLGDLGSPVKKGYTFQAPPQAAQALSLAGFDVMSLANNHILDYGPLALQQGIDLLRAQGIATAGAGENLPAAHAPVLIPINGLKLAFLAYVDVPVEVRGFDTRRWIATNGTPGLAWADPVQIRMDVSEAQKVADLVIVLLHSGYEGVIPPSPPQVTAARAAIDAGAHLVIGHHAHVLQGVEFFNRGVIAYGLGNFAFEDGGSFESALLHVWVDREGVRAMRIQPVILEASGRPRQASALEAAQILQRIYALTRFVETP